MEVATTGDLSDLFATHDAPGSAMADLALRRLENAFYKPVSPQTPIAGEVTALRTLLDTKKVGNATLPTAMASGNPRSDGERAAEILAFAQQHYASDVGPNGRDDLADAALRGIMGSVHDPYTVYLSPREIRGLNESLSGGNFGGIGVYIYQLKDGRIVVQPIEAMPAARAGMKPGEVVDSVDGKPVRSVPIDRVEQMIRGEAGSMVRLRAHRITRLPTSVPTRSCARSSTFRPCAPRSRTASTTSGSPISARPRATKCVRRCSTAMRRARKAYILDLRDNGGGLLDAAVSISSLFIPQGTIVSTIRRDGQRTSEEALGDAIGGLHPLVILVNKYTASASEITAGALQDYHLATLIGTRTFGKGVVQSIFPLPDQGALKITTARYLTPAGRDIQHHGIQPDVVVEQDPNPSLIDTPADKQLAAAKARLRTAIR